MSLKIKKIVFKSFFKKCIKDNFRTGARWI